MVSSLAGSLAVVTCREPLRVSLTNHLRSLFSARPSMLEIVQKSLQDEEGRPKTTRDAGAHIDSMIQDLAKENLNLGCSLIEKAVVDKSLRDIDDHMHDAVQVGNMGSFFYWGFCKTTHVADLTFE